MRELAALAGIPTPTKGKGKNVMHGCRRNGASRAARILGVSAKAQRSATGHTSQAGFDIYAVVDDKTKAVISAGLQGGQTAAAQASVAMDKRPLADRTNTSAISQVPKRTREEDTPLPSFDGAAMGQMMQMMQMQIMQKMMLQMQPKKRGKRNRATEYSDSEDQFSDSDF
jgi:hypothetical protein